MKKTLLLLLCLVLFAFNYNSKKLSSTNGTSGYTSGNFSVTDAGTANYTIPFTLTPGSAGVQPPISISYNSQSGNGLLGLGWSLQGFSVISRASQTLAQDGKIKGIDYNSSDRFALDGERLVLVDTNTVYGGNNVEYRTEQNAFYKIVSLGSGGEPSTFRVYTNAGYIMEYGATDDTRVKVEGTKTIFWLVEKVIDIKGNYYTFKYSKNDQTAEYYPIEINYTGNAAAGLVPFASVKFEYESRTDSTEQFRNDSKIVGSSKRIKSVKNYYGDTVVRSYSFTYQYTPTNLSQLTSLQECGMKGECHDPTIFKYSNSDIPKFSTYNFNSIQQTTSKTKIIATDLNADGVQDILKLTEGLNLQALTGNKNISSINFDSLAFIPQILISNKWSITDINGDGKPDILSYDSLTGQNTLYLNQSETGTKQIKTKKINNAIPNQVLVGSKALSFNDFDGDGRSDLMSYDPITGENKWMFSTTIGYNNLSFLNIGTDSIFSNIITPSSLVNPNTISFTDLNSDGLTDAFVLNTSTGENWIYYNKKDTIVKFDNLHNIFPIATLKTVGGRLLIQDMTGDGLPDFFFYIQNTGVNYWWQNKGNTIFTQRSTTSPTNFQNLIAGSDNLLQLDFNGDGHTDLVWLNKSTGENRWFANKGDFKFNQLASYQIDANSLKNYDLIGTGNFSSKSYLDFFTFNNSANPKAKFIKSSFQTNNLLSTITTGNGAVIDLTYDLLTSDSVYKKSSDALYPLMDYQASQFVVKSYRTDDGRGAKNQFTYKYYGAKIHLGGRGFRGFSQIDIINEATGITNSKYYLSDEESWKYISSPLIRTTIKLPNGVIINDVTYQNGLTIFYNEKCHYSFVKKAVSKTYEIDGSFVDSIEETNEYDDYGNLTMKVTKFGEGKVDSLVTTYINDIPRWILGRLIKSTLYRFAPNKPTIIKNSAFEYEMINGTGLLTKEIVESDSGNIIQVSKSYKHDAYGNIIQSSVTAWNGKAVETRTTNSTMDAQGRFTTSFTNEMGHVSKSSYDIYLGHALTTTDANNLVTKYYYDGMGRPVKTEYPDGNWVTTEYKKCSSSFNCPSFAVHLIIVKSSNAQPIVKYYDLLNRELRTEQTGFDGRKIFADITYNNIGLITQRSKPYFSTETPIYIQLRYDAIGRNTVVISPGNRIDSVIYRGRTTIAINAMGQRKTSIKDAKEQVVTILDNQNNALNFDYDAAGRIVKITDPNGNTITSKYNILGHKIEQTDPDLGTYKYMTNGFGELVSQTDSKNNRVTFEYDSLGRWTKRTESEGLTTRTFDTKPYGIGLLAKTESYNNYYATYTYDALGRIIADTQRIDGQIYTYQTTYDSLGRVDKLIYPSGFTVKNQYNIYGYLEQISNAVTGQAYWTVTKINSTGAIEQQLYGNGTRIDKKYDPVTDFLTQIITHRDSIEIQNDSFSFNALGILTQRRDLFQNKQENFWYDDLNRLIKSKVAGKDSVALTYDILGNITSKSDVGIYTYGTVNAGPHQVQSIDLFTTQCIPSNEAEFVFTSFDKVKELKKEKTRVTIDYNPDRQRNVHKMYENNQLVRTKIYVSGLYEKEIKNGDTVATHYIKGPEAVIATYTTTSKLKDSAIVRYFHRDHLGTAVLVTNEFGLAAGRYSFDAWGKRRNYDWSAILTDTNALQASRGFTGHEHYDVFDLIDMNGRVYDPLIGRFISADPFIQDITNLQSYNRYSYVLNNPLSYTDPSGYFLKKLFKAVTNVVKAVVNVVKENWREIVVAAVAITVGVATGGAGIGLMQVILSGAASGFASGATATLLSGGSLGDALKAGIKGAVISGISAGFTYGVGETWGHATTSKNIVQKTLAHGVVQGGTNVAQGGKFIHGFMSGALTSAASGEIDGIKSYNGRVAASAVLGGTVSEATGGSFANGAITGAFVRMYNEGAITTEKLLREINSQNVGYEISGESIKKIFGENYPNESFLDRISSVTKISGGLLVNIDINFIERGIASSSGFTIPDKGIIISIQEAKYRDGSKGLQLTPMNVLFNGKQFNARVIGDKIERLTN